MESVTKAILDWLLSTDLFYLDLISLGLRNRVFDVIMPIVSDASFWRIPLVLLVLVMGIKGKRQGIEAVLIALAAIALSDFLCGSLLKPLIARPRPWGTTLSFPSCHASNMFALALVLSFHWQSRWVRGIAYFVASMVAYSRVYTTSHYPSDVVAGMIIGSAVAVVVYRASRPLVAWWHRNVALR